MKNVHYRIKIDDGDVKAEFYENGKSFPVVRVNGNLNQERTRRQLRKAIDKYSDKISNNTKELLELAEQLEKRDEQNSKFEDWLR